MAQISLDGGRTFYGPYALDCIYSDIMAKWYDILYEADPYVLQRAQEEHGNFGDLGLLEYYLLHAHYDLIV